MLTGFKVAGSFAGPDGLSMSMEVSTAVDPSGYVGMSTVTARMERAKGIIWVSSVESVVSVW
jgi:hypothetical protein